MMTKGQHVVRELRKTNKSWQMFTFREYKGETDSDCLYQRGKIFQWNHTALASRGSGERERIE